MRAAGEKNPRLQTPGTNSPTVSIATHAPDRWISPIVDLYNAVETCLIETILAWDSAISDTHMNQASRRKLAPRAVLAGGKLYVVAPDPDGDPVQPGEKHPQGYQVMFLSIVEAASVASIDPPTVELDREPGGPSGVALDLGQRGGEHHFGKRLPERGPLELGVVEG